MTVSEQLDADTIEAIHAELVALAEEQDQAVVALVDPDGGIVTAVERKEPGAVRWTHPVFIGRGHVLWLAGSGEEVEGLHAAVMEVVSRIVGIVDGCVTRGMTRRRGAAGRRWSAAA
jgi:hypothetical protein